MIATDFMPKNEKAVCENCKHYEECPTTYVCPTLDRIYSIELLEKIISDKEYAAEELEKIMSDEDL